MTAKNSQSELSYEQSVERLEEIVRRIESSEAGLEESIKLYEEGMALGRRCKEILTQAEQRVEQLSRESAGLDPARPNEDRG
ncbi:Exodeoxyribonuclease 7 small subunit [Phycisphaerales bacterium]|nr:Exodeoxyribonuclease 7 small subunit [Phycisphaerales bacterium]